jgi:ferric-dicitrate binding protein FerR (iron transport regulator)
MEDRIDKLFREKSGHSDKLPQGTNWSPDEGWKEYTKHYGKDSGRIKRLYIVSTSTAAAIIIMAINILGPLRTVETIVVCNDSQNVKEVLLPDSNRVWLNLNTTIEYPSRINQKHNLLKINGEAYFRIRHIENFEYIVQGQNALVRIEKPTAFNIQAYNSAENVDITVSSGAVKIVDESNTEAMALIVAEGNYCSVHKSQKLAYASVNKNNNYLAWKTGKLVFNNQPIAKVTDILAKYYDTEIEIEDRDIAFCRFSGSFEEQPLDTILKQIKTDLNLVIKQTGSKITFSGKGC